MNFEASRAKAIDKLNNFIEKNLSDYSRLRNFDFGPDKRDNVSCLSPYVTHGVLNEIEIIKKSLAKFSFSKNEKFIQEVLWRTYWKGWLELRPKVWTDYLVSLNNMKEKFRDNKIDLYFYSYHNMEYNQLGKNFVKNLSFLDLLFNLGKDSREFIKKNVKQRHNVQHL